MLLDLDTDAVKLDEVTLKINNMAEVENAQVFNDEKCVPTKAELNDQNGFSNNMESVLADLDKLNDDSNIDDIDDIDALLSPKSKDCSIKPSEIELYGEEDLLKDAESSNALTNGVINTGENDIESTEDKNCNEKTIETLIDEKFKDSVVNGDTVIEKSSNTDIVSVEKHEDDKKIEASDEKPLTRMEVEDAVSNSDHLLAILEAQDDAKTTSPLSKDVMVEIPNPDLNFSELNKSLEKEKDASQENNISAIIDTLDLLMSDDEQKDDSTTKSKIDNTDVDMSDKSNVKTSETNTSNKDDTSDSNENKKSTTIVLEDDEDSSRNKDIKPINEDLKLAEDDKIKTSIPTQDKSDDNKVIKEDVFEPVIPLDFMKTFKSTLGKMTRGDLEEFCLVKIAEAIRKRSNLNEVEEKLKRQTGHIELLRKTLTVVTKQNRDLEIVMMNLENEHKKRLKDIIEPVRITRSVGFQVGVSNLRMKNVKLNIVPEVSNVIQKQSTKNTTTVTTPRTPNADNVVKKKAPVTPQTSTPNNTNTIKKPDVKPVLNQKNTNSNIKNIPIVAKPKPSAEKRPLDNSIDLTDDEPPSKQVVTNNRNKPSPQMRAPNVNSRFYLINNSQQNNAQKYPNIRPRLNTSTPQAPPALRALDNNTLANRVGIPIKCTNNGPRLNRRAVLSRHPAPLPASEIVESNPSWKAIPPKPELKISKVPNGIVISWIMEHEKELRCEHVASYQIYAYQEVSAPPSTDLWKKIGDVKALPLPMACTLTQFMAGFKYYFAVRAVDVKSRVGPFSNPSYILLTDDN